MDMSKYIDRAKLMGVLTEGETQKKLRSGTGEEAYMAVLGMVNFAPAEDVAPVVRGEWITWKVKFRDRAITKKSRLGVFCSLCGKHADNMSDYCPNCGAKMDGDTP